MMALLMAMRPAMISAYPGMISVCLSMIAAYPGVISVRPFVISVCIIMMVPYPAMSYDPEPVHVGKCPRRAIKSAFVRMDEKETTRPAAEHMVGADRPSMVHNHEGVEIVQDIIARKIEIIELERIRDPCIEVNISRGR